MDLPDNYSTYKEEEELFADACIDHLSVHDREKPVKSCQLTIYQLQG